MHPESGRDHLDFQSQEDVPRFLFLLREAFQDVKKS